MTQEEKDLILKYLDLCARVPHDVKVQYMNNIFVVDYISSYKEVKLDVPDNYTVGISEVKPYLFPLSSLTEEQRNSISHLLLDTQNEFPPYGELNTKGCDNLFVSSIKQANVLINYCLANHLDINGLIEKGLALDATGLDIY